MAHVELFERGKFYCWDCETAFDVSESLDAFVDHGCFDLSDFPSYCDDEEKLPSFTQGKRETKKEKTVCKPVKLCPISNEELRRWYENDVFAFEISEALNVSTPTVTRWLGEAGIKVRTQKQTLELRQKRKEHGRDKGETETGDAGKD